MTGRAIVTRAARSRYRWCRMWFLLSYEVNRFDHGRLWCVWRGFHAVWAGIRHVHPWKKATQ